MTSYHWLDISCPADFGKLIPLLGDDFAPDKVVAELKKAIAPAVCGLMVETEYVDKDYRSTFYNFYAKKGRRYSPDCIRIHFFDETVTYQSERLEFSWPSSPDRPTPLDHHYFGFIILRPTLVSTIGRSVLSPDVRTGAHGACICAKQKLHVLGYPLTVWGFPSMDQHTDISVCAHVACWSILRYYSERFPQHREQLVHDVTLLAHQFDPGGLTPANGLDTSQAERVFQAAGTFPITVAKGPKPEKFYRQMLAYIESGFPLFVAMSDQLHAIAVIGHSWAGSTNAVSKDRDHAWDQVQDMMAVDDNYLPYLQIPLKPGSTLSYSTENFDEFIAALPEKLFYAAEAVEQHSIKFLRYFGKYFTMPHRDDVVRRYFVTTISGLRDYYRRNFSQIGERLLTAVMELRTAQFVWVLEYSSAEQWGSGTVAVRAVLDATASPRDPNPVWFVHSAETAVFFDRSPDGDGNASFFDLQSHGAPLSRMERNLRPVAPKGKR